MRAMLLGRGERQDGDGARHVVGLEIGPGHLGPKSCGRHGRYPWRGTRLRTRPKNVALEAPLCFKTGSFRTLLSVKT